MKTLHRPLGLGLVALFVHCVVACGDDEPNASSGGSGAAGRGGAGTSGSGGKGGSTGSAGANAGGSSEAGGAGGAGGAGEAGGTGGAGGEYPTFTCEAAPVGGSDPLIADFSLNPEVLERDGRLQQYLFQEADGTGVQGLEILDGALRIEGDSFTDTGSAVGASFNAFCPYDASAFDGLTFRARGSGAFLFAVRTQETTDRRLPDYKGTCIPSAGDECNGYFQVSVEVTNTWQDYSFTWADFSQPSSAVPAGDEVDPAAITAVSFEFEPGPPYNIFVDHLMFLGGNAGGAGGGGGETSGGAGGTGGI